MSRLRYNNQYGQLGADPGSTGTSITFSVAPDFATITGSDYIPLTLDPGKSTFEIVYLTAYTQGQTTGTITRAAEDATHWPAVAHPSGTWSHDPTVNDYSYVGGQDVGLTASSVGVVTVGSLGQVNENVVAASGASVTLAAASVAIGNDITLSASTTVIMPTPVRGGYCYARFRQAASGGPYTVTHHNVVWSGGVAPVMSTGANAVDMYQYTCDGTFWEGNIAGQAYS